MIIIVFQSEVKIDENKNIIIRFHPLISLLFCDIISPSYLAFDKEVLFLLFEANDIGQKFHELETLA